MRRPELVVAGIVVGIVLLPKLVQLWPSAASWISTNPGTFVTAVATVLIAFSGFLTVLVNRSQTNIARQQARLLQEEHTLRVSPELHIYLDRITTIGNYVQIFYLIVNPGFVPISIANGQVYMDGIANNASTINFPFSSYYTPIQNIIMLHSGKQISLDVRVPNSQFNSGNYAHEFMQRGAIKLNYYTGRKLESKSAWYPPRNG